MIINKKKILYVVIFVIAIIGCLIYYNYRTKDAETLLITGTRTSEIPQNNNTVNTTRVEDEVNNSNSGKAIKVHIVGEVHNPGVYEISSESRIADVIEIAGGETSEADLSKLNLAQYVTDTEQIYVPRLGELLENNSNTDKKANTVSNLININEADVSELTKLPGVGDVIANNIVKYREENGKFNSKEEVKNVTRIGEKSYEQIKDLITVE